MMDPVTKQCRSFCFVTFVDKSSVDTAVKQVRSTHGYSLNVSQREVLFGFMFLC